MSPRRNVTITPRLAAIFLGTLTLVVLLGYSFYAALPYLEGPSLTVSTETAENGLTEIRGNTARVSYLAINGNPEAINEDGSFSIRRAYPSGYTAIIIAAKDRFGREIKKEVSVVIESYGTKEEN
ncbi:hypothetical protein A2841_00800 [Candidatus Kaiserbacteria bacterium RIFCSPHIGHO2_01_FULL_48_10]|uniref:Uncharacterized protein n=1 Tax=Candidatus Kaiserbacteria bacterium RIFCSPHIGHO2_01_FULL_48_10 TaxID=1798476 RepID=A0A1F6C6B1_9BACT|nr:MAG: hypothetical protein A2841_00800 [Candidatus Kaiserbacteria bacterium RIFCSPHIGHO2_01_FULL_48_10]